jgi:uncharacterized protein
MGTIPKIKYLGLWILAIVVLLLLPFIGKIVAFATDYLWFKELDLSSVFIKTLFVRIACAAVVGVLSGIIIYANMLIAQAFSRRPYITMSEILLQYAQAYAVAPMLKILVPIAALFSAFVLGSWAQVSWETVIRFMGAIPFNMTDPLFGKDIGFYVFQLPTYKMVWMIAFAILGLSFIGSLFVYLIRQHIAFDGRRAIISPAARVHALLLTGLLVASLYFHFQFKMYGLVNGVGHIINGAGYADINYYIPVLRVMRFLSLAAAVLIFISIWTKKNRFAIAGAVILVGGALLGKTTSQIVQKLIVAPNEVNKETPYIKWSINQTRKAYNLTTIEERHFAPADNLTAEKLAANDLTVKNVRLWDQAPLLTTYGQLQEIRTYYEFLDVDNDRYEINNEIRQVMLSPRELVSSNLPSRIWINEHLTYTHGNGLCLGPVNSVTPEGLPDFFIKNIPPESSTPVTVTRPEIYYGEAATNYAIVNTKAKEFDYPSGNENVYTTYNGKGGVTIGNLFKRMLFVIRFKELKIFLSTDITPQSRILYSRQIMERVKKALPFLMYDPDPYMVITHDGRLVWLIDGYTTTNNYPYSAFMIGIGNYIRNPVKVVIDAYDGSMTCYLSDATDPIINAYAKVFPGVFHQLSDMPVDIRAHIRYPQSLFTVQARVYALYHMNDPQVFYNKEDLWKIPDGIFEGTTGTMAPYYTVMKLAEVGQKEEFILMIPFSPAKKDNMIAWFCARCDEPNYGKLLVFDFPKQNLIYGPQQIESRINQDPEISKALALWNQGGSRVIRGSLLVIPIEQSLLYIQPLYIEATQTGGVPELKRVLVTFGNEIVMEETLEKSLNAIFGAGATVAPDIDRKQSGTKVSTSVAPTVSTLAAEANRAFQTANDALLHGDWAGYGESIKKVESILREISAVSGAK